MKKTFTIIDALFVLIVTLICCVMLYPFLYSLSYSLSEPVFLAQRPLVLMPLGLTWQNYKVVFDNPVIPNAFMISVLRTVAGVIWTCAITGLASYALSKDKLPGRKFFSYILIIPMYAGGGMIANYVNIFQLSLNNTFWVYILPAGFATYYMLIMRTFYLSIPSSLEESAYLDGAGDFTIFRSIIFPLSTPIFACIALFAGVAQWNSWFDSMVYVNNAKLYPLQIILQGILLNSSATAMLRREMMGIQSERTITPETIQSATLIVTVLPIIMIYPFLQKYFVKGMMIGAIKA